MATANQINYNLTLARTKLSKLNNETALLKAEIKRLESEFKKARIILIAAAAEKRKAKKKPAAKKVEGKKKAGKKTVK